MGKQGTRFLTLASAGLALVACKASPADLRASINDTCPRSGKAISADSLTEYRGYVVGFCNTHCRDDFTTHVDERPHDTDYFDAIITLKH